MGGNVFTIGVIGHRNLGSADRKRLYDELSDLIMRFKENFPSLSPLVLTSLAEGADQVAAEVCLDLNLPYVAVIPGAPDVYEQDFAGEARTRFRLLLSRASGVYEVTREDGHHDESLDRKASYQACARFLANHSCLLVAAWNGMPPGSNQFGGTADTIAFRARGLRALPSLSSEARFVFADSGPTLVLHIESADAVKHLARESQVPPDRDVWECRAYSIEEDETALAMTKFVQLVGDVPVGSCQSHTQALGERASEVAVRMKQRYAFWMVALLVVGCLSIWCVGLAFNDRLPQPWAWQLGAVCLLVAVWAAQRKFGAKENFHALRAVAEGARVQEVWQGVGIAGGVSPVFLADAPRAAPWIRWALKSAHVLDVSQLGAAGLEREGARAVTLDWIDGQVRYFRGGPPPASGAIARERRLAATLRWAYVALLALAMAAMVAGVMSSLLDGDGFLVNVTEPLFSLMLATAVAVFAFREAMAFDLNARRYEVVSRYHEKAAEIIRNTEGDTSDASHERRTLIQVARDLGERSLRESDAWFTAVSDREARPT